MKNGDELTLNVLKMIYTHEAELIANKVREDFARDKEQCEKNIAEATARGYFETPDGRRFYCSKKK